MGARTDFPNINYVFGFLNQDWRHDYDWKNGKPMYQSVIRFFKTVSSQEMIDKAIIDLKSLIKLGKNFDNDDWYDYFMSDSSLGYYPPGDGLTEYEWLKNVLLILEEPMETTKKEFIPEFIR